MSKPSRRPLIGLTLDAEPAGGWSKLPWYAVRQNYFEAVVAAGGLPVALPHEPELADDFVRRLDGLIVTGGAFDVDPALYGAAETHETVTTKNRRTRFEWAVTEAALARDLPVLGICGGQQLLNVVMGGTLIQHIPDRLPNGLAHEQPNPRTEPGHDVTVRPDSLLHAIAKSTQFPVNSAHHQAVDQPAPAMTVTATAADGIIEAIEDRSRRFVLGVQWHPEYGISDADRRIFAAFVEAARGSPL